MSHKKSTRRTFIQSSLGAAVALGAAPAFIRAAGDATTKPGQLGTGRHTYELDASWPQLPADVTLGYTHGVCVDAQNNVYIFNQSASAMCVFDEDGKFIKKWNNGYDAGAHGLTLVKEGGQEFLWLCDYATQRVVKTTLNGEEILKLDMPPLKEVYTSPEKYKPTNVAPIPGGDIYVADGYGQSWIHQFDNAGKYIRSFGGPGKAPGKFNCPHGLMIDTRTPTPTVIIADRANVRLQTMDLEGKPVAIFGHKDLRFPCHFDLQSNGDLLIPDLHGRVTIFDKDNTLVTHLGDNPGIDRKAGYPNLPKESWQPGKFISPHSACWDKRGDMYVVEWVDIGRITKLKRVVA